MNLIRQYRSHFTLLYTLLFICFTACSHKTYVREPTYVRTVEIEPARNLPRQDPITVASITLKPQNKGLVCIDPGHGGKDLGTYSKKPVKYQEKHLNLTTAYMLRNYLVQLGYKVVMTRDNDTFVTLEKRAEMANEQKPNLFISVHYNSAPSKAAEGVEIFYYRSNEDPNRTKLSKKLGNAILKRMLANTEAKSRGVKHGDLSVVRNTSMPAVLVEGGFLTNVDERDKLANAVYLKKLAWGMAQGIDDYLKQTNIDVLAKNTK